MKIIILSILFIQLSAPLQAQERDRYIIHDEKRPQPLIVKPVISGLSSLPPSDAIILFGGKDLSKWRSWSSSNSETGPAEWSVENDYFIVKKKTSGIQTIKHFGDIQLHIEWSAPIEINGQGQARGNSGVFFMTIYEVQILDSYDNTTYPDGQTAAIYGQYPPAVNVSSAPGTWQNYDIVFYRPRFDNKGNLMKPSYLTVFHNGVIVHHNRELMGPTTHKVRTPYSLHPDRLPLSLQNHGNPVRFRNVWVRELE